jgi:hypothetical protein
MSDDHELVPVATALPGMVLSDELLDSHGLVLLAKGTVLSEAIILSLARHQIDVVPVARVEAHRAPDAPAVQARLDFMFRRHDREDDNDWAGNLLRRYVEDYRLERKVTP